MSSMNLEKLYIGGRWVESICGLNGAGGARMDFLAPYGGFKQSGIGREGGPENFQTYTETKTILLD